jgi:hypothetical protein
MNPDQNQNQYPIDYLNQIAPPAPKAGMDKKFLLIIGGGIAVVIIALIIVFSLSSASAGPKDKMQTLAARMTTLETISKTAQRSLKSGSLRNTNSTLTIFLTNANHDIAEPLKNNGIEVKTLDKGIVAKEDGKKLTDKLEEARLNAVYDRTYSREMTFELEGIATLMGDIYDRTSSKSLKDFLLKTDENLQPIKEQFSEFADQNG